MSDDDSLPVSEIFASLQGEGPSVGVPCVFLRLAHCNLRCVWCDTPYTWDWKRFDRRQQIHPRSTAELVREIRRLDLPRLVVTGGEPLLHQDVLAHLVERLPHDLTIEIETNGTILPNECLQRHVDQWNVSPKLASSGEPEHRRIARSPLAALRDTCRAWLKVVVGDPEELAEAFDLVRSTTWPRERVCLMPRGDRRETLRAVSTWLAPACLERGFRYSPRLHVELYDGERGR